MEGTTASDYIGKIGENLRSKLTLFFKMDCSNDTYDRWLHKLYDEWQDVIVWWGGHELTYADQPKDDDTIVEGKKVEVGQQIDAEFHVRQYTIYEGEKQTLVVRLREWRPEEERKRLKVLKAERKRQWMIEQKICPECAGTGRKRGKVCKECQGGW